MKKYLAKRRRQQQIYFVITGPALSAINLLRLKEAGDDGLNIATVWRNIEWCWSTFSYLGDDLSKRDRTAIVALLGGLQRQIYNFDWDSVDQNKQEDGYTEAMRFIDEHQCPIHFH